MNILMVVTGDSDYDPRVIKERDTLKEVGHTVCVWDWKDKPETKIRMLFSLFQWYYYSYQVLTRYNYDVVHCHDFDTLFLGVILKKYYVSSILIYDAHEMYAWMTNIWLVLPFEKLFLTNVNHILTVSVAVNDYLHRLTKTIPLVIENSKDRIIKEYSYHHNNHCFTVSYFGTLSSLRLFPEIVDAFKNLILENFNP